jgi:hypothetical protein
MILSTKPAVSTCYSLRKLLLRHADELKAIVAQKTGFCINSQVILEQLLHSVYLEEVLEQILQTLYADATEISQKVQQLEQLNERYQKTVVNNPFNYSQLGEIKRELFCILGFQVIIVEIEDIIVALNQLSHFSTSYLGNILTLNTWQSTRPQVDWLNNFQINRSTKKFTFSGTIVETADAIQLQWIQEWVSAFIYQISQTFKDFSISVEQKRIGQLPGGVLLSHVNSYSSWLTDKIQATK